MIEEKKSECKCGNLHCLEANHAHAEPPQQNEQEHSQFDPLTNWKLPWRIEDRGACKALKSANDSIVVVARFEDEFPLLVLIRDCVNACAGMSDPEKEIEALRAWIARLRKVKGALVYVAKEQRDKIEALTKERDDLLTLVNERDARIRGQVDDLAKMEKERDELKAKVEQLENEVDPLKQENDEIFLAKTDAQIGIKKRDAKLSALRSELAQAKEGKARVQNLLKDQANALIGSDKTHWLLPPILDYLEGKRSEIWEQKVAAQVFNEQFQTQPQSLNQ